MDLSRYNHFNRGKKILVIPDLHVKHYERAETLDRLYAINQMIKQERPDIVVFLADVIDFMSCRDSIDRVDGDAVMSDLILFTEVLSRIMSNLKRLKIDFYFCEGNHEERFRRRPENKMLGHDYVQKIVESFGIIWVPFLRTLYLEGIGFSHYMKAGSSRRAASITAMDNGKVSYFCGHEHTNDVRMGVRGDGVRYTVGKLGGFWHMTQEEKEAKLWSGLTILTDVTGNGQCSVHQYPYDHVLEKYGKETYALGLRRAADFYEDQEKAFA